MMHGGVVKFDIYSIVLLIVVTANDADGIPDLSKRTCVPQKKQVKDTALKQPARYLSSETTVGGHRKTEDLCSQDLVSKTAELGRN